MRDDAFSLALRCLKISATAPSDPRPFSESQFGFQPEERQIGEASETLKTCGKADSFVSGGRKSDLMALPKTMVSNPGLGNRC